LDQIIWHDESMVCMLGVKFVRHDEFWVPGHIPGQPLMPGVLMVEQRRGGVLRLSFPGLEGVLRKHYTGGPTSAFAEADLAGFYELADFASECGAVLFVETEQTA
jgi:hypothetical protein